ncbi:MAG TPA: efflux RND transporter periplasmic adaptor subunit [Thermoguttaceae bacterium]|nr:efflux RND transporter periplasmic adaptor subunit [Thermoguttaceae bacterium]
MKSLSAPRRGRDFLIRHWGKLLVLQVVLLVGLGYLLATMIAGGSAARSPRTGSTAASETTTGATLWTCAMHPQVRQKGPGKCPICRMDLTPVAKWSDATDTSAGMEHADAAPSVPGHAAVVIPKTFQQRIGVRIGRVEKGPLHMTVESMGIVQPDETRIARVNIKTEGWVDKLFVNFVGQKVHKGDPLLSIYSPQFLSTQQELLSSLRAERTLGVDQQSLSMAARRRLELWDVPADEIDRLARTGEPQKDLVLRSPLTGTVLERSVYEKQYVTPEKTLYVIGDLSTVWVQAQVYEYEIPHVELGQPATVTIPSLPDRRFIGKVVFVQPTVEEVTRTVQVRIELPNKEGLFKPGMFAQISIAHPMGDGLLVLTSAILRTGERDIAYRVEPEDHFVPVAVTISPIRFGDRFQVLEGLAEGEQIVISANFLIDSESRIRSGGGDMAGMQHAGHGGNGGAGGEKEKQTPVTGHSAHEETVAPGMDHSKVQH